MSDRKTLKLILMPGALSYNELLSISHRYRLPSGFWRYLNLIFTFDEMCLIGDIIIKYKPPSYETMNTIYEMLESNNALPAIAQPLIKMSFSAWQGILDKIQNMIIEDYASKRKSRLMKVYNIISRWPYRFANSMEMYTPFNSTFADVVFYVTGDDLIDRLSRIVPLYPVYSSGGKLHGYLAVFDYSTFIVAFRLEEMQEILRELPEKTYRLLRSIAQIGNINTGRLLDLAGEAYTDQETLKRARNLLKLNRDEHVPSSLLTYFLVVKDLEASPTEKRFMIRQMIMPFFFRSIKPAGIRQRVRSVRRWYTPLELRVFKEVYQNIVNENARALNEYYKLAERFADLWKDVERE